jgi:4-hydroxybenzoate polyprenyltransferase
MSRDAHCAGVRASDWHAGAIAVRQMEAKAVGAAQPLAVAAVSPAGGHALASRGMREWLRLLRVHQYVKNALVFVPLLTAHAFTPSAFTTCLLAALAFSLCASATYIFNDLVDIEADRAHPTKRTRPLAAGTISTRQAILVAPVLVLVAFTIAAATSAHVAALLLLYMVLTTAYSLWFKRQVLLDVVVLSVLYTLRVVVGAVAIDVVLSEWLLAFSFLIFTSLALVKRYSELSTRVAAKLGNPETRDYALEDLSIVGAMAAASGFNAITLFALYVSSDTVRSLYARPWVLWLICPVLMYWIARALVLAHRRKMHDDPIVFALKDKVSLASLAVIVALMLAAI